MKMREFSVKYSKEMAFKRRQEELKTTTELQRLEELNNVNPSHETLRKADILRSKIEINNQIKTNGNIIRSRAEWVELGEKNTNFFLNLEKRNYKMKHITRLKISDTEHTENSGEIMKLHNNFYKML